MVYDELFRETEPSKFITNTSYAVWGINTLSARCVRAQTNVAETQLTPSKKSAVLNVFNQWMVDKRMMPQHLVNEQMSRNKYNKYFNGAINYSGEEENCTDPEKKKLPEEEPTQGEVQLRELQLAEFKTHLRKATIFLERAVH